MQAGRYIKYNIPIEVHAARIYTRKMHQKFCDLIWDLALDTCLALDLSICLAMTFNILILLYSLSLP